MAFAKAVAVLMPWGSAILYSPNRHPPRGYWKETSGLVSMKSALTAFLAERGLQLSEQKTVITHIQEGFNFLGHTVRKYGVKLLTTPAKSKVEAVRQKIAALIHSAVGLTQEALLRQLNPLLR